MSYPPGYGGSQSGYPQPQQSGYPQSQQGGYPQSQQGGYPQPQQGGYPPNPPGPGNPQHQRPGFSPQYPPNAPPPQADPLYGWFCAVDTDRSGRINQPELQRALTQSGITGNGKEFSLETCRLMISMLDRDGTGTMSFTEFKELWNILNGWKRIFVGYDTDRSGSVEVTELDAIVRAMGYNVSRATINTIARRNSAGRSHKLAFDDFVAAVVKLRALTEEFKRLDQPPTGSIRIQYDDFLQIAMRY